MNTAYLDTEFNGFGGRLLSMALVIDENTHFYEVIEVEKYFPYEKWVSENVVPIFNKDPIPYSDFQYGLSMFLRQNSIETVVADWPEDLAHFLKSLTFPNGFSINWRGNCKLINTPDLSPYIIGPRHNALNDALGLMRWGKESAII